MRSATILRVLRSLISAAVAGIAVLACASWLHPNHAALALTTFLCTAVTACWLTLRAERECAQAGKRAAEAAQLQQAESLKSAVLDALAHEIKGPFATVKVSVSTLLSSHPGDSAQQRELLEIADEELERIDRWINEAIRMSRSEAAELRLNKRRHPIQDVIAGAVEEFGPQLDHRTIEVEVSASIPAASFDAGLIEKVIRQLIDNAIKYSPPGSPIRIWAEFTGAEIVVHVADWGCGIPREEQARIFEPYYRGGARASGAPGTGLGLASAKCIMEAHGGEIWVNSVPGAGSVFHISLPAAAASLLEQYDNLERR
ncbi:MAG TPA: ATP-binding protein [Candidatus Acidoferrales bacterium]|nr:ATP-binding protein [Candidatus Acidoferrales bacterium]